MAVNIKDIANGIEEEEKQEEENILEFGDSSNVSNKEKKMLESIEKTY